MKHVYLIVFLLIPMRIFSWDLEKEKNGITVHTRTVEGSELKEFRGKTKLKTDLNTVISLMEDNPNYVTWFKNCKHAEAVKVLNTKEKYIYIQNGAPWPVNDRDFVIHTVFSQDKTTGAVTYSIRPVVNIVAEKKGLVRGTLKGFWKFVPVGDEIEVTYQILSDPGGSIPTSIANFVVVDIPYETLRKMKEKVTESKYINSQKHPDLILPVSN
ncbi:START domain protein [Leptospira selangorensis]|uniref:START domain protein n=1 Tax=Leptospira selangorensis TaxID=2484982 RepID=A0A5F2C5J3_9LEPT|nr:START domain-containing protein [Leptospira selangorensis]TGM14020.1 START domain protein [Leptospira selangorensis]TGM27048.1 START domain protein [Leptospira selangorensis]